jgi:hypothetical protein
VLAEPAHEQEADPLEIVDAVQAVLLASSLKSTVPVAADGKPVAVNVIEVEV